VTSALRPGGFSDWPLVGREDELAAIEQAMVGNEFAGIVLVGEVGVGKTRLAREALGLARAAGKPTEMISATATGSAIPLGALAGLLSQGAETVVSRGDLAGAARAIVARFPAPPVLGVDDAHNLDTASAALVHQMATARRAFVILTIRSGVPALDAVTALWKDGHVMRLDVGTLGRGEVDSLLENALGSHVDGMTLERLWQASRGNALFLCELVRAGLETGSFVLQDGIQSWRGPIPVSNRLRDLVALRLHGVDDRMHAALELVAISEPLEVSFLAQYSSEETLAEMERTGLICMIRDGRRRLAAFTHPVYGEVMRAGIGAMRADQLRDLLANTIEATGARRRSDLLRVAAMRLSTGTPGDPALLVAAVPLAHAALDDDLAEKLARAAVASGGDGMALRTLAQVLIWQCRWEDADAALASLQQGASGEEERAKIVELRASVLLWGRDKPVEAESLLREALSSFGNERSRDEVRCTLASHLLFGGRTSEVVELSRPVFDRNAGHPRLVVRASLSLLAALGQAGQTNEACQRAEVALGLLEQVETELPDARHRLNGSLLLALQLAGRLADGREVAMKAYRRAVEAGHREASAYMALNLGRLDLSAGLLSSATRWVREATAMFREPGGISFLPFALAAAAEAAALQRDFETATAALTEAERTWTPALRSFDADLARARAWCLAARGDLRGARAELTSSARAAEEAGALHVAVLMLHECARLGGAGSVSLSLDRLADLVDGPIAQVFAAHALALVNADAGELSRCSAEFARLGIPLLAGEAAAEAASIHRRAGRPSRAAQLTSQARLLLKACGRPATPALASLGPDPLTPRERAIASLAAQGLTTPVIAAQLHVSERTVESHLQRVYAKLGITSRRHLGRAMAVGEG
jgi:DNA-binding CsgD family transcriptional regulator